MVKYFAVVRQCPTYGLAVLTAVTAIGVLTIRLNPAELGSGLGMVLFVQMFLASGGFAVTARPGHFDPILVQGSTAPRAGRAVVRVDRAGRDRRGDRGRLRVRVVEPRRAVGADGSRASPRF